MTTLLTTSMLRTDADVDDVYWTLLIRPIHSFISEAYVFNDFPHGIDFSFGNIFEFDRHLPVLVSHRIDYRQTLSFSDYWASCRMISTAPSSVCIVIDHLMVRVEWSVGCVCVCVCVRACVRVCVCVSGQLFKETTFELDIWQDGSPWLYLVHIVSKVKVIIVYYAIRQHTEIPEIIQ